MSEHGRSIPAVVLAGGRASPEFERAAGVAKRCLVQYGGRTLLDTVLGALRGSGVVDRVVVVGDVAAPEEVVSLPEADGFVANLFRGLEACADASHVLVSTSDMPFLTAEAVHAFITGALAMKADFVYPIVPVALCQQAYPDMRRTSLRLREGRFTGGNMVLLRPKAFLQQRAYIEAAYALRKSPLRLAMMLGPGITLAVAASILLKRPWVSLPALEQAASRLLHATARALILPHADIAADLDRAEELAALGPANP